MEIILYQNNSEKNKIGKSLAEIATLNGNLKEETSITSPSILIEYDTPTGFNYCYVKEFNRYYYVNDVIVERANLMRLRLAVDVLESFKDDILKQNVIIQTNETNNSKYLPDANWQTLVKTKTDIINFSNGFLDNGEFILITAGG